MRIFIKSELTQRIECVRWTCCGMLLSHLNEVGHVQHVHQEWVFVCHWLIWSGLKSAKVILNILYSVLKKTRITQSTNYLRYRIGDTIFRKKPHDREFFETTVNWMSTGMHGQWSAACIKCAKIQPIHYETRDCPLIKFYYLSSRPSTPETPQKARQTPHHEKAIPQKFTQQPNRPLISLTTTPMMMTGGFLFRPRGWFGPPQKPIIGFFNCTGSWSTGILIA